MRSRSALGLVVVAALASGVAPATAQQAASPARPAGAAATAPQPALDARAVVAEVRSVIAARYVLPERRPVIDAALARGLASGRYDTNDAAVLAERINADLEAAGHDRHLYFNFDPRAAANMAALRAPGGDSSGYERQVRAANHGVRSLRVLPGNIRYLEYDGFHWIGPPSAEALDNAMRFLAGGDAIIIDLRRNGGGSPEAVNYMASHFLPAGRPLVTFYTDGQAEGPPEPTRAEVPAGRMIGRPLYVLTSAATGSAAEEFAGHVAGYRFGELVGQNTSGAGFRNDLVPISGRFVLSVSIGRAVLASTGRDWEAVGIAPTITAPVADALEVAEVAALRRIARDAPAADRDRLAGMADGIDARMTARSPALTLAGYAGAYGDRRISIDDGRLYYQRGERLRERLIPLGGNLFTIEADPALRLDFQAEGQRANALAIGPVGAAPTSRFARSN